MYRLAIAMAFHLGIHISGGAYGMDLAMLFRVAGNGFASAMWFCTMAHCSRRRRRRSDLYICTPFPYIRI